MDTVALIAEMRMVRWMCNVKVKDRVRSKELREGIDDIVLILQQNRLRWYGHVLRKEDTDWVKKCMEYELEGSRPRGRPKRTWREVVQKDCQACNLNREDATDRSRWEKLIKIGWWSGWWVGECFFWYRLTRGSPGQRTVKWLLLLTLLEALFTVLEASAKDNELFACLSAGRPKYECLWNLYEWPWIFVQCSLPV